MDMESEDDRYAAIAKGIYDALVSEMDSRVKSMQNGFEKGLEARLTRELEKSYEARIKELEGRVRSLEKVLEHRLVVEKSIVYGANGRPEKIIEVLAKG